MEISRVTSGQFATIQKTSEIIRVDTINEVITNSYGELFPIGNRPRDYQLVGVGVSKADASVIDIMRNRPTNGSVWEDDLGNRYMVFGREIYTSKGSYAYWDTMRNKPGIRQILPGNEY